MGEQMNGTKRKRGRLQMEKRAGIIILIAGVAILVLNFTLEVAAFQQGLLSGGGAALFAVGLCKIIRAYRLGRKPEKAAEYEAEATDERTYYIAGIAARMALFISAYAVILVGIIAAFVFDNEVVSQVLFYTACFQLLLYSVIVMICNRKC